MSQPPLCWIWGDGRLLTPIERCPEGWELQTMKRGCPMLNPDIPPIGRYWYWTPEPVISIFISHWVGGILSLHLFLSFLVNNATERGRINYPHPAELGGLISLFSFLSFSFPLSTSCLILYSISKSFLRWVFMPLLLNEQRIQQVTYPSPAAPGQDVTPPHLQVLCSCFSISLKVNCRRRCLTLKKYL